MPPKKKRPLKPIKPTQPLKPIKPFQQYVTKGSSAASEELIKRQTGRYSKPVLNERGVVGNYVARAARPSGGNPTPVKRIQPASITKIKEVRAKEYQRAYAKGNQPGIRKVSSGGVQLKVPLSKQAKTAALFKLNKSFTYKPTERAPLKAPGRYRPISAASVTGSDYRKDIGSFTATEQRNKNISDMREKSRIKQAKRLRRTR